MIARRNTIPVRVGNITLGGGQQVVVQSMTNTDTADIAATVLQILDLAKAGSEMVRITVDRPDSAKAVPIIVEQVRKHSDVPIIGDFHFNGHVLLEKFPQTARALDKYRINPGNVGKGDTRDRNFESILQIAQKYHKPIRIGVNGGSLDPDLLQLRMDQNKQQGYPQDDQGVFEATMIESVLISQNIALRFGIPPEMIVLSAKVSEPQALIRIHQELSSQTNQPIHLGLTEAGGGVSGIVNSTAGIANLLQLGIGDTIRVSLTPGPNESRTKEVLVAKEILQALGIRNFSPKITSCPGCGRTSGNQFQIFTESIQAEINQRMPQWEQQFAGATTLRVAVMGCIVNGPGEARAADVGIFFPGKGEGKMATVYVNGQKAADLTGSSIQEQFFEIIEQFLSDSDRKPSNQSD